MKTIQFGAAAIAFLALAACNRTPADNAAANVRAAAENKADAIENMASNVSSAADNRVDQMQNRADAVRDAAENRADAIERNAPDRGPANANTTGM